MLDGEKGIAGIRQLFSYEVPIVPFSVFDARSGLLSCQPLLDAIHAAITASGGNSHQKYWDELKQIFQEWHFVPDVAMEITAAAEQCLRKKNQLRHDLLEEFRQEQTIGLQMSVIEKSLDEEAVAAMAEMEQLPVPNEIERGRKWMFGPGPNYTKKRDTFIEVYNSTERSMHTNYHKSLNNYLVATTNLIRTYYPDTKALDTSVMDHGLLSSYQHLIRAKKDQYLDYYFDGKSVADQIHIQWLKGIVANIRKEYENAIQQYEQAVSGPYTIGIRTFAI